MTKPYKNMKEVNPYPLHIDLEKNYNAQQKLLQNEIDILREELNIMNTQIVLKIEDAYVYDLIETLDLDNYQDYEETA